MDEPFRGYPAFVILNRIGDSFNMGGAGEDNSTWAPLFTERTFAEGFIRGRQGYSVKELATAQSVFDHLIPAKRAGATVVAINPTVEGGGRVFTKPIDRFLEELA